MQLSNVSVVDNSVKAKKPSQIEFPEESIGTSKCKEFKSPISSSQRILKRTFDFLAALVVLILTLPLMLLVGLLVKLDSPGPILFNQMRVGEDGILFQMLKFRSMVSYAETIQGEVNETDDDGNVIHKVKDDPRITRTGRFLRRTSLDELPQLINVLKGEMSLVGPRPEMPWIVEDEYEDWQYQRFSVPQGITGWWQINGRSENTMHLSTKDDVYYVENYSLWLDLCILARTPLVVFSGKGAY